MRPIPVVDALDVAFGGNAMKILPPMSEIPDDFKRERGVAQKWTTLVSDWFFCGIKDVKYTPKPGVDTKAAIAAIKCCMGSWEPAHEHKEAGCAFLLSEWFEDVTYTKAK